MLQNFETCRKCKYWYVIDTAKGRGVCEFKGITYGSNECPYKNTPWIKEIKNFEGCLSELNSRMEELGFKPWDENLDLYNIKKHRYNYYIDKRNEDEGVYVEFDSVEVTEDEKDAYVIASDVD